MRWLRVLAVILATAVGLVYGVVGAATAAAAPTVSLAYGNGTTGAATATATTAPTLSVASNSKLGSILVASNGMTLYHFSKDSAGVSNCTGACAKLWPPLTVTGTPSAGAGVTGKLGTIKRSNGSLQVTYNGWPLYYFSGDNKPGDTTGQGFKNLWYVVSPTLAVATAATTTKATTTATATLPKTGSGPWPMVAGIVLLITGAGLVLVRRRRAA
jgi:LPXTG-motif cell wall-anchored protein